MYTRTFICLANSRKPPSGRCIAGKELGDERAGQWLRPVSARPGREVSEEERRYETGEKAQLLDIISVPLNSHAPLGHQTENHILAEDYYWTKLGTATWNQISAYIDQYDANFWIQAESTYHGLNDKVPELVAAGIGSSLKLIVPTNLKLQVVVDQGFEGRPSRRRLRAHFEYHHRSYGIIVTDPETEEHFLRQKDGFYPIEASVLCISLAEPQYGYASRLVASVITPERCGA